MGQALRTLIAGTLPLAWTALAWAGAYTPEDPRIRYTGRIDRTDVRRPGLIGAGAYLQVRFRGRDCQAAVEVQSPEGRGYLAVEIDGRYAGRIEVTRGRTQYDVAKDLSDRAHDLRLCKATEAQNGTVVFLGLACDELLPPGPPPARRIEFVGDSITCGMGADLSDLACDRGLWYDQHNAYLAYGPILCRALDADWLLSSVSGMGMTRNWNSPGPAMPQVYSHLGLSLEPNTPFDPKACTPDLVCICLGTNDFSDGDGSYDRGPLDLGRFTQDYLQFVRRLRTQYPNARICCLTSPLLSGEKADRLKAALTEVVEQMNHEQNDPKVGLFAFTPFGGHGCTGHPDLAEQQKMADELLPHVRQLMDWPAPAASSRP